MEKILRQIGLSPKEIRVYLSCLKWGSQPASVIAKHTELSRPTVYDVFKSLIKKGLASKTERGATTSFQVLAPENLIRYLEREQQEHLRQLEREKELVEQILPELKSLEQPHVRRPRVKFFEGAAGVRAAYEDTLTSTEDIRAYANVQEMHRGLPNFFPDYYRRRTAAGIFIHTICPDNDVSLERKSHDHEENREIRLIDRDKFSFNPEVNVYDHKVMIASWREKMALLIESEEIADFHKKMFDLLWEKLK
ncbi:MAG: hypothetical protein K9M51_01985 [Candidatus Gracilibacteria bacterium]|nr:hypothetical protein [Candidatus Gracilibacteria bacterium]